MVRALCICIVMIGVIIIGVIMIGVVIISGVNISGVIKSARVILVRFPRSPELPPCFHLICDASMSSIRTISVRTVSVCTVSVRTVSVVVEMLGSFGERIGPGCGREWVVLPPELAPQLIPGDWLQAARAARASLSRIAREARIGAGEVEGVAAGSTRHEARRTLVAEPARQRRPARGAHTAPPRPSGRDSMLKRRLAGEARFRFEERIDLHTHTDTRSRNATSSAMRHFDFDFSCFIGPLLQLSSHSLGTSVQLLAPRWRCGGGFGGATVHVLRSVLCGACALARSSSLAWARASALGHPAS